MTFSRFRALLSTTAVVALFWLSTCAPAFSAIKRVKWDSAYNGPGNDWYHAYHTVQAGLNAAVSGDEVWVAGNTTHPYNELITLKAGVGLYGGFAATEMSRAQRNWTANVTILDGQQLGSVVTSPSAATQSTIIDGFRIQNGNASNGGGVDCSSSSPTVSNNAITGNCASAGGGIYCFSSSPIITNNTITANSASSGGGIYCSSFSPIITNNTITGNSGRNGGGGMYCWLSSSAVSNNIVAFNSSGIYQSNGSPVLRNNDVYGNTGYNYSGLSAGTGDISVDPLLAGWQYGNVHIQPGSPCRNAGWNDAPSLPSTDMDGQPRIEGGTVDIGADESGGTTWPSGPYAIVRVSATGNDVYSGSSWALAKKTIQSAVDRAFLFGGEVWVKAGVYPERIALRPHVYLYGGFAGAEVARSERNWRANSAVIDGGQAGSVVTVRTGYQVSAIDGFTIRNGSGTIVDSFPFGGGIYCVGASPTIANNAITGNSAANGYGGGLSCVRASPTITNNAITGNCASHGGGVYCGSDSSHFTISPTISNNAITGNSATYGGGVYCYRGSVTITNNTIAGNGGYVGGVFCDSSSPVMSNNIVAFNSSGIYRSSGWPALRNNCVYGNRGYNYSGLGAGAGDKSVDPVLASRAYGNVHIQPGSPCRNAGWNGALAIPSTDMDGQPRIQDGTVDIGADESDGTSWPSGPYAIVRVTPTGNDANDGSGWDDAHAKKTVQSGLDRASLLGGDVWVKAGTYNERIVLPAHAHLYGGFAGTETEKSQRNWSANTTTLDGSAGGSVVTAAAGEQVSTIDGFTITNGSASYGAGVYCAGSSPTIANDTITGNTASSNGGGIYCSCSSPTIANNAITGNSASFGGGVYCWYMSPTITNNAITANTAPSNGGGIYCWNSSSPAVSNNVVAFNSSGICNSGGSPVLWNNDVYGNTSYSYSGISAGTGDISKDPLFVDRPGGNYHLTGNSPCINAGRNSGPGLPALDMDGEARIFGAAVDIGADEYWPLTLNASELKKTPEGTVLTLNGAAVSASFTDVLYVESDDRAGGIRVEKIGHSAAEDARVNVIGHLGTNSDGERCIQAKTVTPAAGSLDIKPVAMRNGLLGGAACGLQQGVVDFAMPMWWQHGYSIATNNIGLLVATWGVVTRKGDGYLYVDDGSALRDGTLTGEDENIGVRVLCDPSSYGVGDLLIVTGISSCFETESGKIARRILTRSSEDIRKVYP